MRYLQEDKRFPNPESRVLDTVSAIIPGGRQMMGRHDPSVAVDTAGMIEALRRNYNAGKLADELEKREIGN
jgi:hypothetical protein